MRIWLDGNQIMIDVAFIHSILGQRYFLSSNDALTSLNYVVPLNLSESPHQMVVFRAEVLWEADSATVFSLLVFAEFAAAANSASCSDSPELTYLVT